MAAQAKGDVSYAGMAEFMREDWAMMGTKMLKQLRDAITHLNPQEVRETANRPLSIELIASSQEKYEEMERFLLPASFSDSKRDQAKTVLHRGAGTGGNPDLRIYESGVVQTSALVEPRSSFSFDPHKPQVLVEEILKERDDLSLPLAKRFQPFRMQVSFDTIWSVSRENALFSLATAVPSIMPFVGLPWMVGEFASDTAFLTMNQIRMAFLLAGASDRNIGYKEQRAEIASLFAGAFGWRALARELVGKIPMGGGLLPKAAVGFAGTYVVGLSLERYYRLGYGYTREERRDAYGAAYDKGKAVANSLLETYRGKQKTTA